MLCNTRPFRSQVAEMLQAHGCTKYFTKGVKPPKMHQFNRRGQPERDMDKMAGVGIALERSEANGAVHVKRIAAEGSAAADGRLRIADAILAVDGIPTTGIGQELTNLIIGPEGTYDASPMSLPAWAIRTPACVRLQAMCC
jgi:C-terminal processing protease CtpA/Prc